jgi:hypothetical protein
MAQTPPGNEWAGRVCSGLGDGHREATLMCTSSARAAGIAGAHPEDDVEATQQADVTNAAHLIAKLCQRRRATGVRGKPCPQTCPEILGAAQEFSDLIVVYGHQVRSFAREELVGGHPAVLASATAEKLPQLGWRCTGVVDLPSGLVDSQICRDAAKQRSDAVSVSHGGIDGDAWKSVGDAEETQR